jgi:hypothetical protein
MQFDIDPFEYRSEVVGNLGIPKPHHAISFAFKPELSFAIASCGVIITVMPAVDLDDEPLGRAEEVDDIGADGRLSPEVRALKREFLEHLPQLAFVGCRIGP